MDISDFRPGEHAPMNEAKKQAIHLMRTDIERAVIEFKQECETELTSREEIRSYVKDYCEYKYNEDINENHLTHAISGAGMINARRRIKEYKMVNNTKHEIRHAIVIVKGNWTPETVDAASSETLWKEWPPPRKTGIITFDPTDRRPPDRTIL